MTNDHKKDDKTEKPADVKQPSAKEILESQPEGQRHPEGAPPQPGPTAAPEPKTEKHEKHEDDDDDDDEKGKKHK